MKQVVTKRLPVAGTRIQEIQTNPECSVIAALKMFASKWKPCILCYLAKKPMRYNDLYRIIPNISRKMLSEHLKELAANALIIRIQFDKKLQRVEYRLSEKGESLLPLLNHLQDWGLSNVKNTLSIEEMLELTMY